jgi:hypothetical protein
MKTWKCLKCGRKHHKTIWVQFKKSSKKDHAGIWVDECLSCGSQRIEESNEKTD